MKPNDIIYQIKQNRRLSKIWGQLSRTEKEEVIQRLEKQKPSEIEKVLVEVKTGQYRLF